MPALAIAMVLEHMACPSLAKRVHSLGWRHLHALLVVRERGGMEKGNNGQTASENRSWGLLQRPGQHLY